MRPNVQTICHVFRSAQYIEIFWHLESINIILVIILILVLNTHSNKWA